VVNELKPPAEMTRGELAREINEANRRAPGPWSDDEWRRFLAVASEFISRIGRDDIDIEIKRTKRIVLMLLSIAVVTLAVLGLVIFGIVHVGVVMR